jgi:hemerythrin-like domain-containing protein
MQRSPQLAVLSREHHVALEIALRLQRATDDDSRAVIAATLDFWNAEGRQHFALEEELLLPALAAHTSPDDPDIQRILTEHGDLHQRITDLSGDTNPETIELHELGERLRDHVRYEERQVFGRIETTLSSSTLCACTGQPRRTRPLHRP